MKSPANMKPKKLFSYLFYVLLFLAFSCQKNDTTQIQNLNGGEVEVIGHQGSGLGTAHNALPPNSLASIQRAINGLNADGVEVDVEMSVDGELFLYHDKMLESLTDCEGCITGMLAEDLERCKYDVGISNTLGQAHYLVKLEDLLTLYQGTSYLFYLDIRFRNRCDESLDPDLDSLAQAIHELVTRLDMGFQIRAISLSVSLLQKLQVLGSIPELYLDSSYPEWVIEEAAKANFQGISISNDLISAAQVEKAHQLGLKVSLFDVKIRSNVISAISKHPDMLNTDNIELCQQVL